MYSVINELASPKAPSDIPTLSHKYEYVIAGAGAFGPVATVISAPVI